MITPKSKQVKSILIVDNSTSNLGLMRKILENYRYHVEIADSGESALNHVTRESPDLILLNLMMLTSANSDITSYLDDITRLCEIPLLFFNGNMNLDHEQMKNLGINTKTYKSFGLNLLLLNINNLLQAKNEQQQISHQQQIENLSFCHEKIILLELSEDDPLQREQEELEAIQNNHSETIFWEELLIRGYEIIDLAAA